MIPLFKVSAGNDAVKNVSSTINSGFITEGERVKEFEGCLAKSLHRNEIVSTNSCTSALQLSFEIIKRNNKGIPRSFLCSPLTCAAGIFAGMAAGFVPVWCDIEPYNFNIDLDKAKELLCKEIQIISFVHWGGTAIDFNKLQELKDWYFKKFGKELFIVEDCAHCFDEELEGTVVSEIMPDNFKCYSFQAIKHVTCGDGGAVLLRKEWYDEAKRLRWFGIDRENNNSFRGGQDITDWGFKFHMNDIAASIGIASIANIDQRLMHARTNAYVYDLEFGSSRCLMNSRSPWLYSFLLPNHIKRDSFIEFLELRGIGSSPVHSRADVNSCILKSGIKSLPNDSIVSMVNDSIISIPVGWWVSMQNRDYIANTCKEAISKL